MQIIKVGQQVLSLFLVHLQAENHFGYGLANFRKEVAKLAVRIVNVVESVVTLFDHGHQNLQCRFRVSGIEKLHRRLLHAA